MLFRIILGRVFQSVPTLLGVVTLVFFFLHLVPGDPVDVLLGDFALPADREAIRKDLHLDLPLWEQYMRYITGLIQGDWGQSLINHQAVLAQIVERTPATMFLASVSLLIALLIAVPMGWVAARFAGRWPDMLSMGVSIAGVSIPNFWLGPMLIMVFSVWLGLLPVSGNESALAWVLPAFTLGTALSAALARMIRSSWLEVFSADALKTSRAMGVSEGALWFCYGARLAAVPVVTLFSLQLGAVLTGAVITETVFDWPGLGLLTIEAIQSRDYPLVQGCVLVIALGYIAANLIADIVSMLVDPRQRQISRD